MALGVCSRRSRQAGPALRTSGSLKLAKVSTVAPKMGTVSLVKTRRLHHVFGKDALSEPRLRSEVEFARVLHILVEEQLLAFTSAREEEGQ